MSKVNRCSRCSRTGCKLWVRPSKANCKLWVRPSEAKDSDNEPGIESHSLCFWCAEENEKSDFRLGIGKSVGELLPHPDQSDWYSLIPIAPVAGNLYWAYIVPDESSVNYNAAGVEAGFLSFFTSSIGHIWRIHGSNIWFFYSTTPFQCLVSSFEQFDGIALISPVSLSELKGMYLINFWNWANNVTLHREELKKPTTVQALP